MVGEAHRSPAVSAAELLTSHLCRPLSAWDSMAACVRVCACVRMGGGWGGGW